MEISKKKYQEMLDKIDQLENFCEDRTKELYQNGKELIKIKENLSNAIEKLNKKQLALIESSNYQLLAEMGGSIAHEVNNPLTIISLNNKYIKELIDSNCKDHTSYEELEDSCNQIDISSKKAADIINRLRRISNINQSDLFEEISIVNLMSEIAEICRKDLEGHNIKFDINYNKTENTKIICCHTKLSQAILQLIYNSLEALQERDNKWIKIELNDLDHSMEITVIDSGNGIVEENRHLIMNPFFTTKKNSEGGGLGLCLAKSAIDAHRGELTLDASSANTKFIIILPKNNNINVK